MSFVPPKEVDNVNHIENVSMKVDDVNPRGGQHVNPVDTRHKLLDAAQDLLDEGGPTAVTLREVGRRAGVSHNAPYKHFTSKEGILAELAARELTVLHDSLAGDLASGLTAGAALARSVADQTERAVTYPERYRLIYGRWESSDLLDDVAAGSSALLAQTVRDAQAAGEIAAGDPERISALLRATVRGAAELQSAGHLSADGKGHANATDLVDDLLRFLRAT